MSTTETEARLHRHLARAQRELRLPSVSAGIVRGGELAWSDRIGTLTGRAGGPAPTPTTQYRIGSITKTLVAVAIMRLRDEGAIDLDDRFEDHVPGTRIGRATIAQLLCHGGGVQAETDGPWWERTPGGDWRSLAEGIQIRFRGGKRHHYSNVGYAALGALLSHAHARPWHEVVADEILAPLGMTHTTLRPLADHAPGLAVHPFADLLHPEPEHDAGAMGAAGQYWSTIGDLARWATFLAGDGDEILATETLDEMCEPQVVVDLPGQPWTAAHGLGPQLWNTSGRRLVGHGGSMPGFVAMLQVHRPSGDAAILLANTTSALLAPLATELLDLFVEHEPAPVEPWSAEGDRAALDLVGNWHWGPSTMTVRFEGDHLVLGEPGVGRASRFVRTGTDAWLGLDSYYAGEPLRVIRHTDGAVSHLDIASFRFTRTPYDPAGDVPGGVSDWA
ncbi:MAG: serine hydrolase domain-containing protein [Propionibacteriaceae bacterium]|nr:serine hydrolase domain-containing protein [Propionibacteriaceae bacterium]